MEELLKDLVGTRVQVWSGVGDSEHSDLGLLEACNERWCRLRESEDVVLCFPIANIRLVKGRPQRTVGLPLPAAPDL